MGGAIPDLHKVSMGGGGPDVTKHYHSWTEQTLFPPEPGQPNAPDYTIVANATHGRFADMMRLSDHGVSGASLLRGHRVP